MKIAVVTGASSGMGRETVVQLWEHFKGFDEMWIIARRLERLKELDRRTGVPLRKFALDLTKEEDRTVLESALKKKRPQVKFLVNAAGFGKIGKVEALSLRDETDMVKLNCEALCAVTRMVLPFMGSNSRIIQYGSSAAFLPQPGFAVYAATKSFVLSYSQALNQELRARRIYVTAVCPGPVKTEFFDIAESTGVIPLYKRLVMANPKRVVSKAIRDSVAGKDISVYGLSMKGFRLLCKVLPHRFILALMEYLN